MWKAFPGEKPIYKFVAGHFYNINESSLVQFKSTNPKGNAYNNHAFSYIFYRLATRAELDASGFFRTSPILTRTISSLDQYPIKEVHIKDFPLYVSWSTNPAFSEILKYGKRKARILSKSSVVISKRRAYEAKRLAKKLKVKRRGT